MGSIIFKARARNILTLFLTLGHFLCPAFADSNAATETLPKASSQATFDQLFPFSIKSCVVSPYRDIYHKMINDLNLWGHSVLFLKGVCRDTSSPLPKIQMCDGSVDLTNPDAGTMISVVPSFENTSWVAIEDGKFAFHGNLEPKEVIDEAVCETAAIEATGRDSFENINLTPAAEKRLSQSGLSKEEFIGKQSLGTDYALDFTRTTYCQVFPVSRKQMEDAVQYLNDYNRPQIVDGKPFDWRLFDNNCQHTCNNTLAAVGIKKHNPVFRSILPIGIMKVHTPAGSFIEYAKETLHSYDHFNVRSAFKDPMIRHSFETYGRPPVVHGTMVEEIPMHTENNRLYVSIPKLFAAPLSPKHGAFKKYLYDPRLRDLQTNLRMFSATYERLEKERPSLEDLLEHHHQLRTAEFRGFYWKYTQWLDQASAEVNEMLQRF